MLKKRLSTLILSLVMGLTCMSFTSVAYADNVMYYNFTADNIEGARKIKANMNVIPKYDWNKGYGFVSQTTSMPDRFVNPDKIQSKSDGFYITETNPTIFDLKNEKGESVELSKSTTHNLGGMVFRVKAPAGGYNIQVKVKNGEENAVVSISNMQATRVNSTKFWDAAELVPNLHKGEWKEDTYNIDYANGLDFIDIEIEPKEVNKAVILQTIKITPIENNKSDKKTIYLLGDSTLKSYTFEEAPMCGWGQVFDRLFDSEKINVINYSMGGRSVKQMYQEGRLNDVLMTGAEGDFVFIQSGHNDEKTGKDSDPTARFGTGSTEKMYETYLEKFYLPAIKARGMIPVLVTPMTRVSELKEGEVYENSFTTEDREFPKAMKEVAEETNTPLVDLNEGSVNYLNSIGETSVKAMVMSLEAGETPGKTNTGSYANGHPQNKIDGTHFKETLAKQYARIVAEDVIELSKTYTQLKPVVESMLSDVQAGNWDKVYTEVAKDVVGEDGYYRNQIEKMIQLGAMEKDEKGNFNPKAEITCADYANALNKIYNTHLKGYSEESLTREKMAVINLDAYKIKFREKPKYMTDYNGSNISPEDPNYDPNLIGDEAQYYPLVGFGAVEDKADIDISILDSVEEAYNLGLIRCDENVTRGKMENSTSLLPKEKVTREKAAKSLYFMYVLSKDINVENDIVLG